MKQATAHKQGRAKWPAWTAAALFGPLFGLVLTAGAPAADLDSPAQRNVQSSRVRLPLHSKEAPVKTDPAEMDAMERIAVKIAERLAASHSKIPPPEKPRYRDEPGAARTVVIKAPRPAPPPAAKKKALPKPPEPPPFVPHRNWTYAGEAGPQAWGRLHPEFAACGSGSQQSPIDIRDGIKVDQDPVLFDYRPSGLQVVDTGRTIQANVTRGNIMSVLGRQYELQYFDFRLPAEARVNGKGFAMAVHLVHRDREGRTAIVAVLLENGPAHPAIQTVWNNLPLQRNDPVRAALPLDPGALLPEDQRYYAYMGSLTTPPCTEGVLWIVMKQPASVSEEQIGLFARLYPMNARPIQASAGRLIRESR